MRKSKFISTRFKAQGVRMTAVTLRETITLFKANNVWMARNTDPEVARLFGTDTLPTAFTAMTSGAVVRNEIERLNPKSKVIVQEGN